MVKVWLILSTCILLGFLYLMNEERHAAVSRAALASVPDPEPLAQMQALCRKIHPRQPEMQQACLDRPTPEINRSAQPIAAPVPPQAAQDGYMNSPYFDYCVKTAPTPRSDSSTPLSDMWRQTRYCIDKAHGRL